jgi:hypothetical protein
MISQSVSASSHWSSLNSSKWIKLKNLCVALIKVMPSSSCSYNPAKSITKNFRRYCLVHRDIVIYMSPKLLLTNITSNEIFWNRQRSTANCAHLQMEQAPCCLAGPDEGAVWPLAFSVFLLSFPALETYGGQVAADNWHTIKLATRLKATDLSRNGYLVHPALDCHPIICKIGIAWYSAYAYIRQWPSVHIMC